MNERHTRGCVSVPSIYQHPSYPNFSRSTTISINLCRKPYRYLIFITHSWRMLLIRTYGLMDRWKMCLNICLIITLLIKSRLFASTSMSKTASISIVVPNVIYFSMQIYAGISRATESFVSSKTRILFMLLKEMKMRCNYVEMAIR